jgi:hypothetical protein
MTDWTALIKARGLDIPDEAAANLTAALTGLERDFRPLPARLPFTIEPAITVSEGAVTAE